METLGASKSPWVGVSWKTRNLLCSGTISVAKERASEFDFFPVCERSNSVGVLLLVDGRWGGILVVLLLLLRMW